MKSRGKSGFLCFQGYWNSYGKLLLKDGDKYRVYYIGFFKNGECHGVGVWYHSYKNLIEYYGNFINGDFQNLKLRNKFILPGEYETMRKLLMCE